MKNIIIILSVFISFNAVAQKSGDEKLKSIRVALITQQAELTVSQAEKFWPLYNAYDDKKEILRQEMRQIRRNTDKVTDDVLKANIERLFALKQQQIELEKSYFYKFLKIISVRQFDQINKVERQLRRKILKELRHRRKRKSPKENKF